MPNVWSECSLIRVRTMRPFVTKDSTVAKLFAKHIKLHDSIRFLKSTRTGIAVGTPTRLKDLMDDGRRCNPIPSHQEDSAY